MSGMAGWNRPDGRRRPCGHSEAGAEAHPRHRNGVQRGQEGGAQASRRRGHGMNRAVHGRSTARHGFEEGWGTAPDTELIQSSCRPVGIAFAKFKPPQPPTTAPVSLLQGLRRQGRGRNKVCADAHRSSGQFRLSGIWASGALARGTYGAWHQAGCVHTGGPWQIATRGARSSARLPADAWRSLSKAADWSRRWARSSLTDAPLPLAVNTGLGRVVIAAGAQQCQRHGGHVFKVAPTGKRTPSAQLAARDLEQACNWPVANRPHNRSAVPCCSTRGRARRGPAMCLATQAVLEAWPLTPKPGNHEHRIRGMPVHDGAQAVDDARQ